MTNAPAAESAILIDCEGSRLLGILHPGAADADLGIVMIVGGPQYRIGSHRQYVLLARSFAAAGIPVLRFDHRGVGDSDGPEMGFEEIDADICAAVDCLVGQVAGLEKIVLWGLCDAASAALFYAHRDQRVAGLALVNPWARTEAGEARTLLNKYYLARLTSKEFWRSLFSGGVNLGAALRGLADNLKRALSRSSRTAGAGDSLPSMAGEPLPERMALGLERFGGAALFVLCGDDLTATEFRMATESSPRWQRLLQRPGLDWRDLPDANHTFSRREWRDTVAGWTTEWARSL